MSVLFRLERLPVRSSETVSGHSRMLAAHEVGNAVCTALLQQLFRDLRQQRSAQSRAQVGVETAIVRKF